MNTEQKKARGRERTQAWRAKLVAAGLCANGCGRKTEADRPRCVVCRLRNNEAALRYKSGKVAAGMCVEGCGSPAPVPAVRCRACADAVCRRVGELRGRSDAPIRLNHCSLCGKTGHNRASCVRSLFR